MRRLALDDIQVSDQRAYEDAEDDVIVQFLVDPEIVDEVFDEPVIVVLDRGVYWLQKGLHRFIVAQIHGDRDIEVTVLRSRTAETEYALTIKQPWLWLILHGPKYIENRSWKPPAKLIGSRLWLHAGKTIDQDGIDFIHSQGIKLPENYETGAVLGSAVLADVVIEHDDPWFFGPYGWVLENIEILDQPIPCQGKQKLWQFSEQGDNEMSDHKNKKQRKAVPLLKNIQERAQFLRLFAQQLEIAAREMEAGELEDFDALLDSLEVVEDVLQSATEEIDHAVDQFAI